MIEQKQIKQLKDIIAKRDIEIKDLRKKLSQYEKDSEKMNKRPMQEEMSDDKEILDLLQELSAPDIVVALVNWVKGGAHTMNDLHMHLAKMMKGAYKPKAGGRMGLYAPEVYEEGEELDEKIEKTKGGKYYATSKTGRRLSKKPKTKEAALKQLAAVEASKAERKK